MIICEKEGTNENKEFDGQYYSCIEKYNLFMAFLSRNNLGKYRTLLRS